MPRFRLVPVVQAVLFAQLALLAPLHLARGQRPDSTVARVQRLVNAGDRAAARALADSILQGATEGTPGYAEALYARAFASSSAVEAERDYLRVSVEYPFSPRAEDATMMVAQLKLARSDRIGARRNFERLVREHPDGALTAKAAFWAGRLAVEDGELARGCQSLGTSRARVSPDDVELANQIEYYSQRCSAGALAAAAPADTAVATSTGAAKGVKDATPAPKSARERAKERADAARAEKARLETARKEAARIEKERIAAERARVAAERVAADSAAAAAALAAVPSKEFSVQVAAFPKERDAQALREVLQQRGYEARVWGTKAPFRVRVGRYVTREAADAALARMKASRLNGMVVEAEPQ